MRQPHDVGLRMKVRLKSYRLVITAGIGLLILLLAMMSYDLFVQLRNLSTAEDDNTQWSISQLDTEFANLQVTLSKPPVDGLYDCLLYTSPSPRDKRQSRMPASA